MITEKRVLSTAELKAYEAKREGEGFKVFVNCLNQSQENKGLFLFEIKLIESWRVGEEFLPCEN